MEKLSNLRKITYLFRELRFAGLVEKREVGLHALPLSGLERLQLGGDACCGGRPRHRLRLSLQLLLIRRLRLRLQDRLRLRNSSLHLHLGLSGGRLANPLAFHLLPHHLTPLHRLQSRGSSIHLFHLRHD